MKTTAVNEPVFTKEELIRLFNEFKKQGWVKSTRGGDGGVGGTLEDLLGIKENNLPIPNATEWELKARKRTSSALTTLFHMEPAPLGSKIVPALLLPFYGWEHQQAGKKYPATEKSFRATINGKTFTDRGFKFVVDREEQKVRIIFDASKVSPRHEEWLKEIEKAVGLGQLNPEPYYGFKDLMYKAGSKLKNCFYVQAQSKTEEGIHYFWYDEVDLLTEFNFEGLLECLEEGLALIDFDARTGHNHGVKFRIKQNVWPRLYKEMNRVV